MIIACPECTSPFALADAQIAALVQIECPTCSFRMILDFEAANDAALREPGMSMANGFRDEASYRQAVGGGHISYSPGAEPATQQPKLRAVPEPATPVQAKPPVREPVHEPAASPPADRPPVRHPAAASAAPAHEPAATPAATPAAAPPVRVPVQKPPVRDVEPVPDRPKSRPTLISHSPPVPGLPVPERPAPRAPRPAPEQAPRQEAPQVEAELETHVGPAPTGPGMNFDAPASEPEVAPPVEDEIGVDADVDVGEYAPPPLAPLGEAGRTPPHTPGPNPEPVDRDGRLEIEAGPEGPTTTKPSDKPKSASKDAAKPGTARTVFMFVVLALLLALGGLMVWSMITTGDPLQKIMELTGMQQPAPESAPAPDAKAGAKTDTPPAG